MRFHFIKFQQFHQIDKRYKATITLQCEFNPAMQHMCQCVCMCLDCMCLFLNPVQTVSNPSTQKLLHVLSTGMSLPIILKTLSWEEPALVQWGAALCLEQRMSFIQC